jgi:minor extracellular serine protease Vpr
MRTLKSLLALFVVAYFVVAAHGQDLNLFRQQSGIDSAVARYNVSGKGVAIAILDRGIQWHNPDFIKPDGTTRIKWMLDMSGQNGCDPSGPTPVEYSAAQINAALIWGETLDTRDAVGHGTVTAGIAAGNGRAFGNGKYTGVAPDADLIIVKMTSEGAPAHDDQPAESYFLACVLDALDWVDQKITQLGEPVVGLINSGVQLWGPIDGTSVMSQKIDGVFGKRPGRIFVAPSGDEGDLPTHAGGTYSNESTVVNLVRSGVDQTYLAMWFKRPPVSIDIAFDDDGQMVGARTDSPGRYNFGNGIAMWVCNPETEFCPVKSISGDHFVILQLTGHATKGRILLQGLAAGAGRFDMYSDMEAITKFTDHLVPGRLTDLASTKSAIVVGAYVSANAWIDIDDWRQIRADIPGQLWRGSAGGPTRDGRGPGVDVTAPGGIDVTAPGGNVFGTYATNSYWSTFRYRLIKEGGGFYGWQSATSGAAPIAVGAVALMLEMKPDLRSDQVRTLLRSTATSDSDTGSTPNNNWGYGKINVRAVLDQLCADFSTCGTAK